MSTSAQSGDKTPGAPRGTSGPGSRRSRAAREDAPQPLAEAGLLEVRFLTVAEVASVMRVSKMTVYRMVHAGELPAARLGRSFRVPEGAVHDYLRKAYIEAG